MLPMPLSETYRPRLKFQETFWPATHEQRHSQPTRRLSSGKLIVLSCLLLVAITSAVMQQSTFGGHAATVHAMGEEKNVVEEPALAPNQFGVQYLAVGERATRAQREASHVTAHIAPHSKRMHSDERESYDAAPTAIDARPSMVEAVDLILPSEPVPSTEELVAALELEGSAIMVNVTTDLPPPTHFTNAQLLSCLDGVHLRGFGDSHGRYILQSPLSRFGSVNDDRQRVWNLGFPPAPQTAIGSIGYKFQGRPTRVEAMKLRNPHATNVLISRGTWDVMQFSTTQEG
jgi:hypothetical protein